MATFGGIIYHYSLVCYGLILVTWLLIAVVVCFVYGLEVLHELLI